MTRSVGVALLAMLAAIALALASTLSSAVQLLASTALIMSGTFTPTPPPAFVDMAKNHFILPTHPGQAIGPFLAVTTPEEAWPVTGLFDLPFGDSVAIGLSDLQAAMVLHGNDNLVIFGHSQSSVIAYLEKRRLAEQFPKGTPAPDIDFVTIGTLNLPNGGVMTRFWGLYLPFVDFYFNGPAPTDTQFDTVIITQRWDGFADFPIYPIVWPSVLNAIAGFFYVHEEYEDVTLAGDPSKFFQGTFGDTDYYFFETENLPIYGPLRSFGVPEPLIDIVEPLTTFVVELGYRRDIPPWVPSPVRLIPVHDPAKVVDDFLEAVDETIDNTLAVLGSAPPNTTQTQLPPAANDVTSVPAAELRAQTSTTHEPTEESDATEARDSTGTEDGADEPVKTGNGGAGVRGKLAKAEPDPERDADAPRPRVSGPHRTSASSGDRASAGSASAGDSTDGPAKP